MILTRAFLLIAVMLVTLSAQWSGTYGAATAPSQCESCPAVMALGDLPDEPGDAPVQGADISADPADPCVAGILQAAAPDARAELAATSQPRYKPAPAQVLLRPPRLA